MSENILLEIQRKQATAAREVLASWLAKEPGSGSSRGLVELVAFFLETPERLRQARSRTFDQMLDQLADSDLLMEELRQLFDEATALLETLRQLVHDVGGNGSALAEAARLDRALNDLASLRAETFAHWERFTPEEERKAKEEIDRGESLELDEALAHAAGMDKATWQRKVEERRRGKP